MNLKIKVIDHSGLSRSHWEKVFKLCNQHSADFVLDFTLESSKDSNIVWSHRRPNTDSWHVDDNWVYERFIIPYIKQDFDVVVAYYSDKQFDQTPTGKNSSGGQFVIARDFSSAVVMCASNIHERARRLLHEIGHTFEPDGLIEVHNYDTSEKRKGYSDQETLELIERFYLEVSGILKPMTRQEFIIAALEAAREGAKRYRFNPEVAAAQAALESNWGKSTLAQAYNNLKGVKAHSRWKGKVAKLPTSEWSASKGWYKVYAPFCHYDSWAESFEDYGLMIESLPWYSDAVENHRNPKGFLEALVNAGEPAYATDPKYVEKVWAIMEQYGLTKVSAKPPIKEWIAPFLRILAEKNLPKDVFIQVVLLLIKIYNKT